MDSQDFRTSLFAAGLLVDGGVDGLYHRSFAFEGIVRGVERYVTRAGRVADDHRFFFSPVMARSALVSAGYVRSFPDLIGVLSSFTGGDRELPALLEDLESGGDWTTHLSALDVALCSAACHNLYPRFSHHAVSRDGQVFEVQGVCFRHEPSPDPARMQSFRMHEFVYLGSPEGAFAHREEWITRGGELLRALGLDIAVVVANDPFFGRVGRMLANGQLEKELKFELVAPISSDTPGAIASANYHEDHMGLEFDISLGDGEVMHSACFGFGLDRIALALIRRHGTDLESWPSDVTERLGMDAGGFGRS